MSGKQKTKWKEEIRSMAEGDCFSYRVEGWKSKAESYTSDVKEVEFVIAKGGEIHCAHPGCSNPTFGAPVNSRAEYNVYLHIQRLHEPPKRVVKRKEGNAVDEPPTGKVQANIKGFFTFTTGQSPQKKKANTGNSPSSVSTLTASASASASSPESSSVRKELHHL